MKEMNRKNQNIFFWTASIGVTLFFCLLTFLFFSEWWTVAIKKDIGEYPWGHVNENPWYYDNPNLYAMVNLTEGLIMLLALSFTVWFLTHQEKSKFLYSLLTCFGIFVLIIISGQVR